MRVSEAFPSNYLRAADLQGRDVTVIIEKITSEDIGDDHKPVLYFAGKDKGLVLNKTNANNIALQYGDDMDDWIGKLVTMFPTQVDFQGKSVEAIRIRMRKTPTRKPPIPDLPPEGAEDDIPF